MKRLIVSLIIVVLWSGTSIAINRETKIGRQIGKNIDAISNLGPHEITIDDRKGAIILRGEVSTERAKTLVEEAARSVEGVQSLTNNLVVVPHPRAQGIAKAIQEAVTRNGKIENYRLDIHVQDHDVVLTGEVQHEKDAARIEEIANGISGVKKVTNNLTVPRGMTDDEIRSRVLGSLREQPDIDLEEIGLEVRSGVVHVTGHVRNHREIDRILAHILMIDGVQDVKSRVQIGSENS